MKTTDLKPTQYVAPGDSVTIFQLCKHDGHEKWAVRIRNTPFVADRLTKGGEWVKELDDDRDDVWFDDIDAAVAAYSVARERQEAEGEAPHEKHR